MNPARVKTVVVTSDLYRVDDRMGDRLVPPAAINTRWVYELFAPILSGLLARPVLPLISYDYPDPLSRIGFYRRAGREFSSSGWASFYDGLDEYELMEQLAERLAGSLVLSYELPPYMQQALDTAEIPYIDLFIHPVRFLPDYMFGIRSNVRSIADRLCATAVPEELIFAFARISAARTARVHAMSGPVPGSAAFLGQIGVDASLVANGRLATLETVEAALLELASAYPVVYYKPHPHLEDPVALQARFATIQNLEWVAWNVYDLLALRALDVVASLSSGGLVEARYFGTRTKRYLQRRSLLAEPEMSPETIFSERLFVPAPPAIFEPGYWRFILGLTDVVPELRLPPASDRALKFSLDIQWGR